MQCFIEDAYYFNVISIQNTLISFISLKCCFNLRKNHVGVTLSHLLILKIKEEGLFQPFFDHPRLEVSPSIFCGRDLEFSITICNALVVSE